jgi:hypothetical protein
MTKKMLTMKKRKKMMRMKKTKNKYRSIMEYYVDGIDTTAESVGMRDFFSEPGRKFLSKV